MHLRYLVAFAVWLLVLLARPTQRWSIVFARNAGVTVTHSLDLSFNMFNAPVIAVATMS